MRGACRRQCLARGYPGQRAGGRRWQHRGRDGRVCVERDVQDHYARGHVS